DVPDEDHLGVRLLEHRRAEDGPWVAAVAVGQELVGLADALGRLEQPLPLRVLADELEDLAGVPSDGLRLGLVLDVAPLVVRWGGKLQVGVRGDGAVVVGVLAAVVHVSSKGARARKGWAEIYTLPLPRSEVYSPWYSAALFSVS